MEARRKLPFLSHLARLIGNSASKTSVGVGWTFRPLAWVEKLAFDQAIGLGQHTKIDADLDLYHDATSANVSWQQNQSPAQGPYPLAVVTSSFDGNFISLAVALPNAVLNFLSKDSILTVTMPHKIDGMAAIKLRIVVKRGANTFAVWQANKHAPSNGNFGFEMARCEIDPSTGEAIWLDIILSNTKDSRIDINDVLVSHRLRAEY